MITPLGCAQEVSFVEESARRIAAVSPYDSCMLCTLRGQGDPKEYTCSSRGPCH